MKVEGLLAQPAAPAVGTVGLFETKKELMPEPPGSVALMVTGVGILLVKGAIEAVTVGAASVITMVWLETSETLPATSRLKAEMVLVPLPSDSWKLVTGTVFQAVSAAAGGGRAGHDGVARDAGRLIECR